jgi:hypothetical protein
MVAQSTGASGLIGRKRRLGEGLEIDRSGPEESEMFPAYVDNRRG